MVVQITSTIYMEMQLCETLPKTDRIPYSNSE